MKHSKMTRREAMQQIAGLAALPLITSCGVDRLLSPSLGLSSAMTPVSLIGAGDPHALSFATAQNAFVTGKMIADRLAADPSAWAFCNGDLVPNGTAAQFKDAYHKAWGGFKVRTLPTIGNHDLLADPTGTPYYDYWGELAGPRGKGYYAKTFGNWRGYFLNSQVLRSEQAAWLAADLTSWTDYHIFAVWHQPHYVSPCNHGGIKTPMGWPGFNGMGQFWEALQKHQAEFVVSGHAHRYERFPRMKRNAKEVFNGIIVADPTQYQGIRQFVIGTGGVPTMPPFSPHPQVEKIVVTRGVVKFTLYADRYEWNLTDLTGVVRDSGRQSCRKVLVA
jgi:acid phosphatase type 7